MDQNQKELIDKCIQSHYNMIMQHRKAIIELSRKTLVVPEICIECVDYRIIDERNENKKQ